MTGIQIQCTPGPGQFGGYSITITPEIAKNLVMLAASHETGPYWIGPVARDDGELVKYEDATHILAQRDRLADLVGRIAAYLENNPDDALVETLWLTETTSMLEECQIALAELDKENKQ